MFAFKLNTNHLILEEAHVNESAEIGFPLLDSYVDEECCSKDWFSMFGSHVDSSVAWEKNNSTKISNQYMILSVICIWSTLNMQG